MELAQILQARYGQLRQQLGETDALGTKLNLEKAGVSYKMRWLQTMETSYLAMANERKSLVEDRKWYAEESIKLESSISSWEKKIDQLKNETDEFMRSKAEFKAKLDLCRTREAHSSQECTAAQSRAKAIRSESKLLESEIVDSQRRITRSLSMTSESNHMEKEMLCEIKAQQSSLVDLRARALILEGEVSEGVAMVEAGREALRLATTQTSKLKVIVALEDKKLLSLRSTLETVEGERSRAEKEMGELLKSEQQCRKEGVKMEALLAEAEKKRNDAIAENARVRERALGPLGDGMDATMRALESAVQAREVAERECAEFKAQEKWEKTELTKLAGRLVEAQVERKEAERECTLAKENLAAARRDANKVRSEADSLKAFNEELSLYGRQIDSKAKTERKATAAAVLLESAKRRALASKGTSRPSTPATRALRESSNPGGDGEGGRKRGRSENDDVAGFHSPLQTHPSKDEEGGDHDCWLFGDGGEGSRGTTTPKDTPRRMHHRLSREVGGDPDDLFAENW